MTIKKQDGTFIEVQIKASGENVKVGDAARFSAIKHEEQPNYYFIFKSERMKQMWIMSSADFIANTTPNQSGKHAGERSICLNGCRTIKATGEKEEYCLPQFEKFLAKDYSIFK